MKKQLFFLPFLLMLTIAFSSCEKDDDMTQVVDPTVPTGAFTADASGSLTAQSGTPTSGDVELGMDEDGDNFLHFANNFTTNLATGTVTIYLSTSDTFTPDPGNGNPDLQLIGAVRTTGDSYYKIDGAVDSKFTHVILWCGTANIPFGYAPLN